MEGVLVHHAHYPVVIVSGDKYLEVRIRGVNKGELVFNVLKDMEKANGTPDFVMCIGNDDHDEYMYLSLRALMNEHIDTNSSSWYSALSNPGRPKLTVSRYCCTHQRMNNLNCRQT